MSSRKQLINQVANPLTSQRRTHDPYCARTPSVRLDTAVARLSGVRMVLLPLQPPQRNALGEAMEGHWGMIKQYKIRMKGDIEMSILLQREDGFILTRPASPDAPHSFSWSTRAHNRPGFIIFTLEHFASGASKTACFFFASSEQGSSSMSDHLLSGRA